MTHARRTCRFLALSLAAAAVLAVTGCKTQSNHEKNVNAAKDRYLELRSGLMLQMAQQQFDTGDIDLAEKNTKDALTVDPSNPRLLVLAARIAIERGQLERAYHLLNLAIEKDPKATDPHYYQGIVHQRWQQYEKAHAAYQKAYDIRPDNAGYLMAMAEMLVAMNKADEALALLEDKLVYFDQHSGLRVAVGQLYQARGDYAKAASFFEQASLLRPEDLKLKEDLALAWIAGGSNDKAVTLLRELLEHADYKDRTDLRRALAGVYLHQKRNHDARDLFMQITRAEPTAIEDWLRLAQTNWALKDLGGTIIAANRVMTLDPQRHEGYLLAGMVWQKRGRLDDALKMFDRAAEASPASATPLILRGIALEKAGRPEAAAEAYRLALVRDPADARATKLLEAVTAGVTVQP
mgnify:CR=1 FL=1